MKIQRHLYLAFILISLGWIALSCDENEPQITGLEPFFKIKLINQDSLSKLETDVEFLEVEIKTIEDSVDFLDSLNNQAGDPTDYSANRTSLNEMKTILNSSKSELSSIISVIESGKVMVTKIAAEDGTGELLYEDSLTSYTLPLNSNANFSRYFISINDTTYTLDAAYQRHTIVKERNVMIQANQFDIIDYSFDTVTIYQPDSTNFNSNEAIVNLYF